MTWGWDAETINPMNFQEARGDSHIVWYAKGFVASLGFDFELVMF